jgi:Uma2 family endonuclease
MRMPIAPLETTWLSSRKRWTRKEYDQLVERGILEPDARVELIDGDIVEKLPQKSAHASAIRRTEEALRDAFASGHDVRCQFPLALDDYSEPEPDLAVVAGSFLDYEAAHPTTAILVVEVADSSLAIDRAKAGLYARAGIPEYWIVNLVARALEVYSDPHPAREQPLGHAYRVVHILEEGARVSPRHAPSHSIAVADLLPRMT